MRRAQSTLEYIMIIGVLAVSLIVMGAYVKRGFHGNIRAMSDQLGDQYDVGKMTTSNSETTTVDSHETTISYATDGTQTKQKSVTTENQDLRRRTNENVEPLIR